MWNSFLADVAQHFQDKEAILAKAGYPAADQHAHQHRALVEKAIALATRFYDGTLTLGELFKYLAQDVVSQHMLTADHAYVSFLKSGQ